MDRTEDAVAEYRLFGGGSESLMAMASEPILLVQGDGRILRANPVARRCFPGAEVLPFIVDGLHTGVADNEVDPLQMVEVQYGGRRYQLQTCRAHEDSYWVWLHSAPNSDCSSALSTLFESSNVFTLLLDAEGRILRANGAAEDLSGYPSADLQGKFVWDVLAAPQEVGHCRQQFGEAVSKGRWEHRASLRTRSGEHRYMACSAAVVPPGDAETKTVLATGIDLTDFRHAEAQLAEAEERYRKLVNTAFPLEVIQCDSRIVHMNPAGAGLLGAESAAEFIGRPLTDIYVPEQRESVTQRIQVALDNWQPVPPVERQLLRKDGSIIEMEAVAIPVFYHGRPATHAVFQDISRRKRNELELARYREQLEELVTQRTGELLAANRELEAFSHSVSHDLRTPLRAINGFSSALLEDYGEQLDAEPRRYLERIGENSARMGRLIEHLLVLSQVTRQEMRREQINLSELAEAVVEDLRAAEPERGVEVFIEPGLVACGDAAMLRIVVQNLVGNAWKYSARRERARIEFRRHGAPQGNTFCISDNGVGFDPVFAGELFNAFRRLHGSGEFEGNGIGLATVKRIVRRHGGEVWAEGAEGEGARFFFQLPAEAPNPVDEKYKEF